MALHFFRYQNRILVILASLTLDLLVVSGVVFVGVLNSVFSDALIP